jgi:hypothetical protein
MSTPVDDLRQALTILNATLDAVVEATSGYKAKLVAAGFSPTIAEQMAVDYHRHFLAMVMAQAPGAPK